MRVRPLATAMPLKPACRSPHDRARADGRQVDPEILSLLRRLDEHAAFGGLPQDPGPAEALNAGQHVIRALRPLDRKHALARDDRRLSDVVGGEIAEQPQTDHDRALVFRFGRARGLDAGGRQKLRREVKRADDGHALLLQQPHGAAQKLVVAAAHEVAQLLPVAKGREGVEHGARLRALKTARQRHGAGTPSLQAGERALHVQQIDDRVGSSAQGRVGEAAERQNAAIASAAPQAVGDEFGQPPRPRQDGDRAGDRPASRRRPARSRGVQIARSPPSRMKSRISCTIGCVANSSATSSTRSASVPSSAKSRR